MTEGVPINLTGPVENFPFWFLKYIFFLFFSISFHVGAELLRSDSMGGDSVLKGLWHHQDAILCCSLKVPIYDAVKVCMFWPCIVLCRKAFIHAFFFSSTHVSFLLFLSSLWLMNVLILLSYKLVNTEHDFLCYTILPGIYFYYVGSATLYAISWSCVTEILWSSLDLPLYPLIYRLWGNENYLSWKN